MIRLNPFVTFLAGLIVGASVISAIALTSNDAPPVAEEVATGGTELSAPPTTPPTRRAAPKTTTTAKPGPDPGSRSNPYTVGDTVTFSKGPIDYWELRVVEFIPDAFAQVSAENQFNELPPDDEQFAMVTVEATYVGPEEPATIFELPMEAVDDGSVTYGLGDSCGVIPNDLSYTNEVYKGGTLSGNLCWSVSSEHIESLLLAVGTPAPGEPPTFMALQ